ncbi:hypothetical protein OKW21_002242 [Catalinimonas alkaloidigena]|nr:hypothetical protein [Catalinimonas alkaloidigena]
MVLISKKKLNFMIASEIDAWKVRNSDMIHKITTQFICTI